MEAGFLKKLKFFRYFWPDNYSSWRVFKREINNRIAAFTSREDFETVDYRNEDWDNLIVLDACRYDTFEKKNTLEGELSKVYSNASHTWNFLKNNFRNDNSDTVYVTGSPMTTGYEKYFHKLIHVWKDNWNDEKRTVLPKDITEAALKASKDFPDKKLIVHYMQPHYPFIGDKADDIDVMGSFEYGSRDEPSIWERMQFEDLDRDKVIEAYEQNLEVAMPEVERLVEELEGKTVVTADHGNVFGKKIGLSPMKVFGHPMGVADRELRSVPWLEIDSTDRREVKSEENESDNDHEDEEIKEKLADLGYT